MRLTIHQASATVAIPKEHHRFVIGKNGEKLQELELKTATKIAIPRPDDPSANIRITGTKEGIEKARHEILLISAEQVSQEPVVIFWKSEMINRRQKMVIIYWVVNSF